MSLTAENPSIDLLSIFVSSNAIAQRAKSLSKQSGMTTPLHIHRHTHIHIYTHIYNNYRLYMDNNMYIVLFLYTGVIYVCIVIKYI